MIESGHTLVLGWSEKGLAVLRQLALANLSAGGLPVVVLCSEKKEDMEETVAPRAKPVRASRLPEVLRGGRVLNSRRAASWRGDFATHVQIKFQSRYQPLS